ncbi:MAG: UDP-glucose 4-epimerase GalE [Oscillospiraceae bacterium]|nr:UDP-glucose 4-epimerase GalE [Oscillospiraceae bacterium]
MNILVTGGAGYIGSHTCVKLLEADYEVTVVDNLSNSSEEAIFRVEKISGKTIKFYKEDLLCKEAVEKIFSENSFDGVIHFAGLKAVGESVAIPMKYYQNNLISTLNLCEAMAKHNVKKLVFSSSATVYGKPESVPISEDFPLSCTNPYGRTKLMIEEMLRDIAAADERWDIAILRYFNPVGAHESGLIGEDPKDIPNNLVPYIAQTVVGKREYVHVFGNDYDTHDGTGVRDYIHVIDLAEGHLCALRKIETKAGVVTYNLGTGKGYSVLDMIKAFGKAAGKAVPYRIEERRPGDIDSCFANPEKAKRELGFEAKKTLDDMCRDTWNWQKNNPDGYGK